MASLSLPLKTERKKLRNLSKSRNSESAKAYGLLSANVFFLSKESTNKRNLVRDVKIGFFYCQTCRYWRIFAVKLFLWDARLCKKIDKYHAWDL